MEVCPIGFFCFDQNTFLLFMLSLIILIIYLIYNYNNKFEKQKLKLENKKKKYFILKNDLENTKNQIKKIENNQLYINNEKNYLEKKINDEIDVINKDHQRIINPLFPPERSHPYKINNYGVPINIPTRGYSSGYQQVGAIIGTGDDSDKKILPLYGMQNYPGSKQWSYYTGTDNYNSVKLPIEINGKNCLDNNGCNEIYDGDLVNVNGYSNNFKVNLYNLDKPRYIPYIF